MHNKPWGILQQQRQGIVPQHELQFYETSHTVFRFANILLDSTEEESVINLKSEFKGDISKEQSRCSKTKDMMRKVSLLSS